MTEMTRPGQQLEDANDFEIAGPVHLHYSSSSIDGSPRLDYRDSVLDLRFSGEEITRTQTVIGEAVSVPVEQVVDAWVRTVTLIVPRVRVPRGDRMEFERVEFETIAVYTTDRSVAFVPPGQVAGVLQTYRTVQLAGTATFLVF